MDKETQMERAAESLDLSNKIGQVIEKCDKHPIIVLKALGACAAAYIATMIDDPKDSTNLVKHFCVMVKEFLKSNQEEANG
jgi:hypothetical protein